MITVGSLFSGIGGLDLGLERAGMRVVWQSEIDPYACRVLTKHWPDVPNLGDITTIDWGTVERPDLICGGYPCQPFSLAGTRAGTADRRHLWPHFADALRHLRPRWALLENVPGHLSLGFGRVLGDLAELGYDTEWQCIPAAAVGAPHLRWRVFIVAHADDTGRQEQRRAGAASAQLATAQRRSDVPDAERVELWQQSVAVAGCGSAPVARDDGAHWDVADTAKLLGDGCDDHGCGIGEGAHTSRPDSGWWSVEPDMGRVAHGVPARVDRLRVLGNAVVPQVAEYVGRRIVEAAA